MNSILRICVPLALHVIVQHTEILTVKLDHAPYISKQLAFHDRIHCPLRIKSLCKLKS